MTNTLSRSPAEVREVLYEFSLAKEVPDAELLDEFVRRYPEHADSLTDFAVALVVDSLRREKADEPAIDATAVSPAVSRAMSTFQNALYANRATQEAKAVQRTAMVSLVNPFDALDRQAFRKLAKDLNANAVFVCKLRDRQIDPKTMTKGFVEFVAEKLRVIADGLATFFAGDGQATLQPQFLKADEKVEVKTKQSFEEAVRSSELSDEQQRFLLGL